jgi:N-acylglucosamine-6-phosphate 2-epimerase
MSPILDRLRGGLIVSCQAKEGSVLKGPLFMGAMAREAERGGAAGLRIDGPDDIAAARRATVSGLPILGIYKRRFEGYEPYITATFELAAEVARAGADLVALDATARPRPGGVALEALIARIHTELGVPVMADISTVEEGLAAARAGAELVSTTLGGYTLYSRPPLPHTPDFELLRDLVAAGPGVPVVVEGRVTSPDHVARAFELGAFAVCVGDAITNPAAITARFAAAARLRLGEG